jgi:hypothetical protein
LETSEIRICAWIKLTLVDHTDIHYLDLHFTPSLVLDYPAAVFNAADAKNSFKAYWYVSLVKVWSGSYHEWQVTDDEPHEENSRTLIMVGLQIKARHAHKDYDERIVNKIQIQLSHS